jgi:phage terminase large subunit-like protein
MDLNKLSYQEKLELLETLEAKSEIMDYSGHLSKYFPDEGPYRFDKYPRHIQFFKEGLTHRSRVFMAANRVGKTVAGAYEAACHLTGEYPDWWEGKRFDHPTEGWAAGDTGQTTRDILQAELLGEEFGTGLIAKDRIVKITMRPGIPGAVEKVQIRHKNGGISTLGFKSFDQGRRSFQGTAKHFIWLDEECPEDVYNECTVRTMTTRGVVFITFTPLKGLTLFVQQFMKAANEDREEGSSRAVIMAGWDDVPHLGELEKAEILADTPAHLRDSRSKGIPGMGSGAIYPIPENELAVSPFPLPPEFRRFYGLDVGWNYTAAVFCAHDRDRDIVYVYDAYKSSNKEPDVHAAAISRRNVGNVSFPGAIDPASRQRNQRDGSNLLHLYRKGGLKLVPADNSVQSGLDEVYNRMMTGRLKVFRDLSDWWDEFRLYRRDEKGRIVKEADHLMDAMRYAVVTGIKYGKPVYTRPIIGGEGRKYI